MAIPEKLTHSQIFTEGMNSILARELMQPNQARYIFNCHIRTDAGGNVGAVTNPKGNIRIPVPLPPGINFTIGTASAEKNNNFYFFIQNSLHRDCIFEYNEVTNSVTKILENLTDTGGIDITRFDKRFLILHADVVGRTLHWVDGKENARKTNIDKLLDKSDTGYGTTILEEFINAYKRTAPFAPTAVYISDPNKKFNNLYGQLTKYAVRFVYMDNERSVYSDWSAVIVPDKEPFTGMNTIPTNNNGIQITVPTGNREVKSIEIIMQSTTADVQDNLLNWVQIATLNKKRLKLTDDAFYTYTFYNDLKYPTVDQTAVIQPYSFMLRQPLCQAIAEDVKVLANGKAGYPTVELDASFTVEYKDLFLDDSTENKYNEPEFTVSKLDSDYVANGFVVRYDGTVESIVALSNTGPYRFSRQSLTIGFDVKKGNIFYYWTFNGNAKIEFTYEATNADTALTVASQIKQRLISSGRIYRKTPDMAESNIYDNDIDVDGNVTFYFIVRTNRGDNSYFDAGASVTPVQYDTLKDTGQSIKNHKMGSVIKLGIEYEDGDGIKSNTYTVDALIVAIQPYNVAGIKQSIITLQVNHRPPYWAKYWQVMRTEDLSAKDYVDTLIQNVVEVPTQNTNEYLDLIIGSFFTYQKIHPNTTVNYQFEKGDRISLKKKVDSNTIYPFFETEVLSYNDTVTDHVSSNLVTNGTATVTVAETDASNIGKIISVEGHEREIVAVPSSTTYELNNVIGDNTPVTYRSYDLIDRRGILRIRKPDPAVVVIENNSLVQVYKPLQSSQTDKVFYAFQKKFPILNPGTENAYHGGNPQDQSDTQPALVDIGAGIAYVRFRELPINNVFPGTQVIIESIEDPSYSDFYQSLINDNGRVSIEDTGLGEVHLANRVQHSGKMIEGTGINGMNNFQSGDNRDYNDRFGDIKLIVYEENRLVCYKTLITGFIPISAIISKDSGGNTLLIQSSSFLNDLSYYAWEGGIGNQPESYASNGTHKYYLSCNSGVIIRFGGNGNEPISKTFFLDNDVRELLAKADKSGARMFGGFDRENDSYIVAIEGYDELIYFDGFSAWIVNRPPLADETLFEVVDSPDHGELTFTSPTIWTYVPDADYVGHDTWSYRAFINGAWTQPRNVCIDVEEPDTNPTAWRPKEDSFFCVVDQYGLRTGYKGWNTLEEYSVLSGTITGNTKPNDESDINYAAPIIDETACIPEPVDDVPNPIAFAPVVNADLDAEYISGPATVSGINVPIPYSGVDGLINKNGGPFIAGPTTVVNGDIIRTKRNSSPLYSTLVTSTVSIGSVSAAFNITTKDNTTPDPFTLIDVTDAEVSTEYISNSVPMTGITGPSPISIAGGGGSYQIDETGPWLTAPGTINPGQTARTKMTSDGSYETTKNTTLTVGGYSDTYSITTKEQPAVGNEYRSAMYRRDDCAVGSTGTLVTTEVAPDTYFADTLAEANALADAYIATVGQSNANSEGFCIVDSVSSIIVVDMTDPDMDACAYIDTVGVAESASLSNPLNIAARNGQNFFLLSDPAAEAFILASDNMPGLGGIYRRFEFNVGKLIGLYPDDVAIPEFKFIIQGRRQGSQVLVPAYYTLKYPNQNMIMNGSAGTYVPSVVPAGGPPINNFDILTPAGGDGSVGFGVGEILATVTYVRATNTVIVVPRS